MNELQTWLVQVALPFWKDVLQAPAVELKILFSADKDNVFTAKEAM